MAESTKTTTNRTALAAAVRTRHHAQRFFFRVPNIVFELDLSPYEFSLYSAIRRTTGDDGVCFRSGAGLARLCEMSSGQVSRCKKRLAAPFEKLQGKPFIRIVKRPSPHGGKPYHEITVVDIWGDNDRYFSPAPLAPRLDQELATSADEVATSARETKKTSERIIPEEQPPSLSPSKREITREADSDLSEFWDFVCTVFGRTHSRKPTKSESKLMLHWIPIPPEEYKRVKWWIGLEQRGYDSRAGIGFDLLRRPKSVRSLLQNWTAVDDVARHYWNKCERNGHFW
jgi:hypothetical protein